MLDHAMKWAAEPDWTSVSLTARGVSIRNLDLPDQALVSGNLAAFGQASNLDPQGAGAFGLVQGDRYTIRLARDRLLVVGELPSAILEGWNEAGFAVTAIGGADHVFELSGEGLPELLSQAMTIEPTTSSPSASVGFAATPAVVYRHQTSASLRLHVERGFAVYVWS